MIKYPSLVNIPATLSNRKNVIFMRLSTSGIKNETNKKIFIFMKEVCINIRNNAPAHISQQLVTDPFPPKNPVYPENSYSTVIRLTAAHAGLGHGKALCI